MGNIDVDANGHIDYNEFVMCASDKEKLFRADHIKMIFNMIDSDGSGKIDLEEFQKIIMGNGTLTKEQWGNITKDIDFNDDNQIDFEEFSHILVNM